MSKPLEGVRVVELAGWAFVPSAGVVLTDWGADVIKVEPPNGDPVRGLVSAGIAPTEGLVYQWEIWNRGKRSIAMDLKHPDARRILLQLIDDADVLLTNYLPTTRKKLGLDVKTVMERKPSIIYACGTGQGSQGQEAEKGGFDSITFWSRGGISSSVTPVDYPRPLPMPAGAFGDSISGMALAGGIAAAIAKKERTGEGSVVDASLLSTAMWAMQMSIVAASAGGSRAARAAQRVFNPLVNNYRTSDDRWIGLCMMQSDVYWDGFCRAIGREDMLVDARFAEPKSRAAHRTAIITELEGTFATKTLSEWQVVLATQAGQWDVVNLITEVENDPQALANGYVQYVPYPGGRQLPIVSSPIQFDLVPPRLGAAPAFAADTDDILLSLGMDMDQILEAKISGAVV
jgi:crotonobetainyl-CoA:carnitine CoA-transferase CaiB-like acyl-CoA transferase